MKVVIADMNPDTDGVKALSGTVKGVQCDVGDFDSVEALKDAVYNDPNFGECGFLFLNAGLALGSSAYKTPIELWRKQLDVNVFGVLVSPPHLGKQAT